MFRPFSTRAGSRFHVARRRLGCAAAFAIAVLLLGPAVRAGAAGPGPACSAAKVQAAATALVCVARQENRALAGGSADLARCTAKLDAQFAGAEAKAGGACPTSGDSGHVATLVTTTESSVLGALQASSAVDKAAKLCVARKNLAAATAARCIAKAAARRLDGKRDPRGVNTSEYARCFSDMIDVFTLREGGGSCPTTGDAEAIADLVNPVGGYLPGAAFPHPDPSSDVVTLYAAILIGADLHGALLRTEIRNALLNGADLSGATLTGADLRNTAFDGADLSGATLQGSSTKDASFVGVVWNDTTCPDGTSSATNGSSPESCCGHLVQVPRACTP